MYNQTKMVVLLIKHKADLSVKYNDVKIASDYSKEKVLRPL
ncbi:hypothetical protein N9R06_00050 [Algibacter sp.]|nr:hypothetical protein [Algibacter sp.]